MVYFNFSLPRKPRFARDGIEQLCLSTRIIVRLVRKGHAKLFANAYTGSITRRRVRRDLRTPQLFHSESQYFFECLGDDSLAP